MLNVLNCGDCPSGARSTDYEDMSVRITSSGGFTLAQGVLQRALASHRSPAQGAPVMTTGWSVFIGGNPSHDAAARAGLIPRASTARWSTITTSFIPCASKPMALLNLVYRDQLFPREAYRRAFEARLWKRLPERQACRTTVELLALAHDRGCESELADQLTASLQARRLPDMAALRERFAPDPSRLPNVVVSLPPLNAYEALLGASPTGDAA